ncbi:hypothetical protein Tco_1180647 [Tanacetum coccineum]
MIPFRCQSDFAGCYTETVQRRALGNVGNTGNQGTQNYGHMTYNVGKKVICYNCRGEGHVSRHSKEKGTVLDAEAEAFLADVECTAPYDQPLAITTTNMFEVSHEDAYDSNTVEGPHAAAAFMANLSYTSGTNGTTTSQVNEELVPRTEVYGHSATELALRKVTHLKNPGLQLTDPCRYPSGSGEFKPVKAMFTEQIIPFYENVKQLVQKLDENIVTEVTEYMRIFDELDTEYERCVLANKNLKIERKNLLIQNDCLIANCLEKDICSIVLASDIVVPPSSNCLCEELRSNCDREHSKVVELEAEILKKQQMLNESKKRCAFIEKNHVNLQVKFQKYKECLQNQRVCDNSNSTASNAIFEINKYKGSTLGKEQPIRNLQTQINNPRMLML